MTEIEQWLRSGAGVREGLRLLSIYKPNVYLTGLVMRNPDKYRPLLMSALSGLDRQTVAKIASGTRSMRSDWPFLSEPDCPAELKILAADKITAWRNFVSSHSRLFSCTSEEECLETARNCVFFYCQNRKIFSEFAYYKEHHSILGQHPVFSELQRTRALRSMDIFALMNRRKCLKDSIWRIGRQLKENRRPDLEISRKELLTTKERELGEVERLIQEYRKQNERDC